MEIRSIFSSGGRIPKEYTCDGKNVNPPLDFAGIPENAGSLVLIVDDPDSPSGIWSHWLLFDISPETKKIDENSAPQGSIEGRNDFGNIGYGGPCPHSGIHRYQFKLFALDTRLNLREGSSKEDIENAMKGHALARAVLTGTYSR